MQHTICDHCYKIVSLYGDYVAAIYRQIVDHFCECGESIIISVFPTTYLAAVETLERDGYVVTTEKDPYCLIVRPCIYKGCICNKMAHK